MYKLNVYWDIEASTKELSKIHDFLTKYNNGKTMFYNRMAKENNFIPQYRYNGKIIKFYIEEGRLYIDEESNYPQIEFIEALLKHFVKKKYTIECFECDSCDISYTNWKYVLVEDLKNLKL